MDGKISEAVSRRTGEQENELRDLEKQLAQMKRLAGSVSQDQSTGDLETLNAQNGRLKFRRNHLIQALGEKKKRSTGVDYPTLERIKALFHIAVITLFPDIDEVPNAVNACTPIHGDYQCNDAIKISQWLKKQGRTVELDKLKEEAKVFSAQAAPAPAFSGDAKGKKKAGADVVTAEKVLAEKLVVCLPSNDLIESTVVSPAGFINLNLKPAFVAQKLTSLIREQFPPPPVSKKLKVIVDYSSPNIAKQMHVGHLRSTIIGDSIANLLEFIGYEVVRLNHLGDWGTQFGMLIAHLKDKFPNYLTVSPPIGDLQTFYKEAKVHFDEDPEFKRRAHDCVVSLQNHEEDIMKAWKLICEVSFSEMAGIYQRLKISRKLMNRGESFYDEMMKEIVRELEEAGLLKLDEPDEHGRRRKLMFVPEGQIPLTIAKGDGAFTYDTSDMATIRHRLQVEKCDWNIYVIDSGQEFHIDLVVKGAKLAGWLDPDVQRCQFVGFGLVLGEDKKKFKTRSGDTVQLAELLDEGLARCEAKLKEKGRDKELTKEEFEAARDAVAYGCIKYADLSKNRLSDYVFSFDKMLDDRGNTAAYLLYAYTRIRSIARNAGVSSEDLQQYLASVGTIPLEHEKELKLAKKLNMFHEALLGALQNLFMNQICDYLYELSSTFTEFYDNCYCIEKDRATGAIVKVHRNRLLLCEATAGVMDRCFSILGITPVSKM
ncbi:hypothetical protein RvY_17712 [Ramazzottius varieornatus]|uniref:arginine--tRNA ligase n=1 Tax=Ramazzottius varieornatus TaxID=947166 RepID=A0A1D1W6V5_RAMVA|nr:hypothetical protein RvY_17712 [Ramazzottius varieornatus]